MVAFTRTAASMHKGAEPDISCGPFVSSGLAELDAVLGGGLPLGCVVLLLEDDFSMLHLSLLQHHIAEGLHTGQKVLWVASKHAGTSAKLPQAASMDRQHKANLTQGPADLKIAWKYKQYALQHTAGSIAADANQGKPLYEAQAQSKGFARCHAYDLTRLEPITSWPRCQLETAWLQGSDCWHMLSEQVTAFAAISHSAAAAPSGQTHRQTPIPGLGLSKQAAESRRVPSTQLHEPASALPAAQDSEHVSFVGDTQPDAVRPAGTSGQHTAAEGVRRIAVQSLGGLDWFCRPHQDNTDTSCHVLTSLLQLQRIVRGQPIACMVTLPAGLLTGSNFVRVQYLCAAVLQLQAVHDDSPLIKLVTDATSCVGMLRVLRLHSCDSLRQAHADSAARLLRHRRRRLRIEALELDPHADTAMAQDGGLNVGTTCASPGRHS